MLDLAPITPMFAAGAVADGLVDTAARLNMPATMLPTLSCACISDWAPAAGVATVVTPYAPVGPVTDELAPMKSRLETEGITLIEAWRNYDTNASPYGTQGFFGMREKIPKLLAALEPIGGDQPQFDLLQTN